jgi:hypothetical protein
LSFVVATGCEERFSSTPPTAPLPPASSSNPIEALWSQAPTDAGAAAVETSRALTITACSSKPAACPASDSESEGRYEVVFGEGHGDVRTRGQAMADLYKELRDRTTAGERLDAEAHSASDGGTIPMWSGPSSKPSAGNDDPLSQCAFQLLDLVDGVGEVTLDVVHASGRNTCRVSLGRAPDGGVSRCLIQEPERVRRMGR